MAAPRNDMSEKHVMLTGFTAGLGMAAAYDLASMGASLTLVCRNPAKGKEVAEGIRRATPGAKLDVLVADLGRLADVRRVAEEFLATGRRLDVLFNNAGVVNMKRIETEDGLESTFAVNHLGHFLLSNLLIGALRASRGRVVSTASDAHKFGGPLDFDDLQMKRRYSTFGAYGRSKLANILFTRELARREAEHGVTALCFHPGFVGSDFSKNNGPIASLIMTLGRPFARSIEKGAETGVYLCSAPGLEDRSGGYFCDMKPLEPNRNGRDDTAAERLWVESERLAGLAG